MTPPRAVGATASIAALGTRLAEGIASLGLDLDAAQQAQLLTYLGLIAKWNGVYNLTAIRDPAEMLTHHLLDSLAVVRPLRRHLGGGVPRHRGAWLGHAPTPRTWDRPGNPPEDGLGDRLRDERWDERRTKSPDERLANTGGNSWEIDPSEPATTKTGIHILDVGAGAGLPGVVLSIALSAPARVAITIPIATRISTETATGITTPMASKNDGAVGPADTNSILPPSSGATAVPTEGATAAQATPRITCVDAVAKKAGFIRQVAAELRLPHLNAAHGRIENLRLKPADVITCRAWASLSDIVQLTAPHLAPGGVWMAMKGQVPAAEIQALPAGIEVFHVEPLQVPFLDGQRCLVWMRPRKP